jgi:hypothetical protein
MKKFMLSAIACLAFFTSQAQLFVNGIKLDASNTGQYIEINPKYKSSGFCVVEVDYGNGFKEEASYITDDKARRIEFKSSVDVLNFLYTEGWETAIISKTENSGRRYLLKRRF